MSDEDRDLRPVAGGSDPGVRSADMDATDALGRGAPLDQAAPLTAQTPALAPTLETREPEADREQISIGQRLRQPRTIISILVPLVIIVLFAYLNRSQLSTVPNLVFGANPLFILVAFVIYYLGFPLRGYRWTLLLRGTGLPIRTKDATEIIFLSWLVNCVVPAKLGDVYRAYLLKINSAASLSRTFGTVFIERILDIFAIAIMGLAAGLWSFRSGLPPAIQFVAFLGVGVIVILAALLLSMRNFGRAILTRLPVPQRVLSLYDRFEEGVFGAVGLRALPRLIVITGFIWSTEALRLYLVVRALNFPGVELGLSGAVFVARRGVVIGHCPPRTGQA